MKTIKTKVTSVAVAAAMLCGMFAVSGQAEAAVCGEPTMLASALRGRPMSFIGIEIGEDKMETLWRIATTPPEESTPFFGKVIAEDQDWLSSCQYPGIGIGAGSGTTWKDRSVTLWVWADAVDLSAARLSIYRLIGVITTTSTTVAITTTTTTVAPTITTSTTLAPITTTTTTTIAAPEEVAVTTTTVPVQYAVAQAVSVVAPVAVQTLRVEVKKASTATKVAPAKSKMKKAEKAKKKKKKAVKRNEHSRNIWHTANN